MTERSMPKGRNGCGPSSPMPSRSPRTRGRSRSSHSPPRRSGKLRTGSALIESINAQLGVTLNVMSGRDEARVTFLAARRWFGWSAGKILLLDIGGGSLEIAAGQDEYPQAAVSIPLGAGRTYSDFLPDPMPTAEDIHRLRKHARAQIGRIAGDINRVGVPDQVVGSSKTFRSLARIAGAAPSGDGIYAPRKLFRRDLEGIIDTLATRTPANAGDPARRLRSPCRSGAGRSDRRRGGLHDLRHRRHEHLPVGAARRHHHAQTRPPRLCRAVLGDARRARSPHSTESSAGRTPVFPDTVESPVRLPFGIGIQVRLLVFD
jgi:hypothetical protein